MQRTFAIWTFALRFVFKYWFLGRKFTYGKQVGGSSSAEPGMRWHTAAACACWCLLCLEVPSSSLQALYG